MTVLTLPYFLSSSVKHDMARLNDRLLSYGAEVFTVECARKMLTSVVGIRKQLEKLK